MPPQEFMDEIVLPSVVELKDNRRSRLRAYVASIVTFHLKDHLHKAGCRKIEDAMRAECGDAFDVVRGICNGTKHVQADTSHPVPFAAGDDWDRPPASAGQLLCGISRAGDAYGGREIGSGTQSRDIYFAVRTVLRAYCKLHPTHLGATDLSGV